MWALEASGGRGHLWTLGKTESEPVDRSEYIAWVTLLSFHGDGDIYFLFTFSSRSKV